MPKASATASATTALDLLARPGSARFSSRTWPSGSMTQAPSSTHGVGGRVNGHSPQRQPAASRWRCEPHSGQHQESSCHSCPAATQVTCRAAPAAQAISGSSALAMTRQSAAASASRQRRAISQISAARSIWSRLRLSSVTTFGLVASITAGRNRSSVSSTACWASGARPSAEASPASMFAPKALVATSWPRAPSPAVISLVVVVLPLVPVTRTIWRPTASSRSSSGSTRRPRTPPITEPSPRPVIRGHRPGSPADAGGEAGAQRKLAHGRRCYPAARPGSRTAEATT